MFFDYWKIEFSQDIGFEDKLSNTRWDPRESRNTEEDFAELLRLQKERSERKARIREHKKQDQE